MSYWYLAINNKPEGPLTMDEITNRIRASQVSPQTLAFTQGMSDWTPLGQIPQFHSLFRTESASPPPVSMRETNRMRSHEIDYEVFGDDMQFVEITLDPQESVIAESGDPERCSCSPCPALQSSGRSHLCGSSAGWR